MKEIESVNSRKENWSNYWKQGLLDSCARTIESADSEITQYWKNVAESIQANQTIVDLCTGAGAVIKELTQMLGDNEVQSTKFYGVELSSYPNQEVEYKQRIGIANLELFNNTSIEKIPLSDQSVDLLVSQFGVEYALSDDFYSEVARLLKVSGKVNFVMHHSNSILYRVANEEAAHYKFINEEIDLFGILEQLVPYFALLKNPANKAKLDKDPKALQIRNLFNQALNDIKLAASKSNHPDLLHDILNSAGTSLNLARNENKKVALEFIKHLKQQFKDSYGRSIELLDAALSKAELEEVVNKFADHFPNSNEIKEMSSNNQIVAWGLSLERTG
ncbi:MAG: class I SAM-dependent methyltransferase [Gammaproteobacteria bacterium]|nr:class I SAM-dependent methyltransferase [Gammaproteobacteria bacterium]